MTSNMNNSMPFSFRSVCGAFLMTLATSVSAAPGKLSDVPLYTRGGAEPNIMFVLDSSGSMEEAVWPPSEYDASVIYSCGTPIPSSYTEQQCSWWGCSNVNKTNTVNFQVRKSDGRVEFNTAKDSTWRAWNSSSNCFDPNVKNYQAWVYANGNSTSYYQTGNNSDYYRKDSVSGNELNWFFSQSNGTGAYFVDSEKNILRSKVDVRRTAVMKNAAIGLLSGLDDVRVGLMQFNNEYGAQALLGLTSIDDENRASILNIVSDIDTNSWTPLAETFAGVGNYFISGYENDVLAYNSKNIGKAGDVFKNESRNGVLDWNGVPKPAGGAIQHYCQKSFMVALTDGDPTRDDSVSDHLKGFDATCKQNPSANETKCTSSQMDDVVKALYDLDLRPKLNEPDGTPVTHNITSYIIGFAQDGLSDTDVMKNAGKLGGGGVYTANNAAQLQVTFNQIISKVQAVIGSSSSVAFNSTSLETGSALYAAKFDSGDWSGKLSALKINDDGSVSMTPSWEAASILDQGDDVSGRVLLTYKPGAAGAKGAGVPFTAAGLDFAGTDGGTEQDLKINTSSGSIAEDTLHAERLAYLRGDRTKEGNSVDTFRKRGSRLGDIVNSTPVYVGAPSASWDKAKFAEASSYAKFKNDNSGRTPVVYVGANDGFLHGFNATTSGAGAGKELIGYSPSILTSTEKEKGLHALSSQTYLHKYYVDGTPTVVDAFVGGAWKSILVGGLGGGGKGYFALDVTKPADFTNANANKIVLWEFSNSNNSNLGYTFSRPQIGRMSNGKWAAIFGNGYDSQAGDAGLFIVYLDGSGHRYLSTSTGSENDKNGLSTPAIVDANLDGTIDRIYAGDLRGNMWAFDVETNAKWETNAPAGTVKKLFTATGEPITGAPLVARNTANENGAAPNLLVTFGTGQYLTATDTANTAAGGFYAVSDNGKSGLTTSNLKLRTIGEKPVEQKDGSSITHRTLSGNKINWSTDSGWYIALQAGADTVGGERVVARPDLLRNVLFFNTMIPTGQVCSAGGHGWLISVDVRTGLAPESHAVYDGNGDGVIDSGDMYLVGEMVTGGMPNKSGFLNGDSQYVSDSAGGLNNRGINAGGGAREGRLSWEEITRN